MKIRPLTLALLIAASCSTLPLSAQNPGPCGNNNNGGSAGSGGTNSNTEPPLEGDPVVPYTGNEVRTVDDLQIWGAVGDYPMTWSRHSNSRAVAGQSLFGMAHYWRHSFQWELSSAGVDSQGRPRMMLVFPDGSTFNYVEIAPNQWSVVGTLADSLTRTPTGFILQRKDSFRYVFTAFGSGSSTFYLLTEVIDPANRQFTFEYDATRRLVFVREPGGRFFKVSYASLTGNRLNPATLAALATAPQAGTWIDLPVSNTNAFTFLRLVQADGSFGNIAEVEFYEAGTNARLNGTLICSDAFAEGVKAMDGDTATIFRSASYSGGFVGIKLPSAKRVGRVRILVAPGTEALHKPAVWPLVALRIEGSNESPVSTTAIARVETGDGRTVNYTYSNVIDPTLPYVFPALTTVVYGDGMQAEYRHTQVFPGTRPLVSEWDDVRYDLRQGNYKTVYQNSVSGAVLGAVTSQINLETGGKILEIGLKTNSTHRPMVTFANGAEVVQYYYANKEGAVAITRRDDGNGNATRFSFDPVTGFVTSETDPLGRVTTFTYSPTGQIASRTHPDGSTESWSYNGLGSVIAYTDAMGRVTQSIRDANNRITRINYADGSFETFTYNALGQPLAHRLPNGGTELFEYSPRGLMVRKIDALGNATVYEYDSADRLSRVTDARNHTTVMQYNERGLFTSVTNPDSSTRTRTYTRHGDVASETNELGHTWTYTYDIFRRVVSMSDPLGRITEYSYLADSFVDLPIAIRTAAGRTQAFTYDKEWNLLSLIEAPGAPDAATTTYAYDKAYNLILQTDAMGRRTAFAYDNRDRRVSATDALSRVTRWTYDAVGNTLTTTRPDGGVTADTFDSMNRLVQQVDPKLQTTQWTYNPGGKVATMTDPRGNTYSWTYDIGERVTAMAYPGGSSEQTSYDAVGNPVTTTTRAGQVRSSVFDARNREIETNWSDSTPDITRVYDTAGRILSEDTAAVSLDFTYDAANQLLTESTAISGQPTRTVTLGYDADGLRTSTQYPGGNVVAAAYNLRGLPSTISLDGSVVATYAFNPVRGLTRKTLENGTETHYTYDVVNQLTAIEHRRGTDLIQRAGYVFDVVGNRVSKTTSSVAGGGAGVAEAYNYDAVDQVVRARYGTSRDVVYGYDAVGNRQSVNDSGTVVGYTANSDNAYTAVGGIALSRDGNGNQLETPGGQYLYDAQNRVVRAEVGGQVTTFVYDARNRVVQRTTDGVTTHLTYEGWNLIEERDATGLLTQVYVHGAGTDELLSKINATGAVYYHADALGSTLALTDATGIAVESYAYDVFGSVTVRNSSGIAVPISTVGNRFAFTGREWIAEAAFYDYRNRIYSPQLGRFLQTDPIRFAAGDVNVYRYCGNNPVNWMDPWGLWFADISFGFGTFWGAGGAIGMTAGPGGFNVYYGLGFSTPGPAASVLWGPGDPSPGGINIVAAGGVGFGGSLDKGTSWAAGIITPGASYMQIHNIEVWRPDNDPVPSPSPSPSPGPRSPSECEPDSDGDGTPDGQDSLPNGLPPWTPYLT